MHAIDLRSDTVTRPSQAMRAAMASAEVGDDVYGEDPTVYRLEAVAAELVGKEAAVFLLTGTAGNQIALLSHTERGQEVILDADSHVYNLEVGAPAMFAGLSMRPATGLHTEQGDRVLRRALRPPNIHHAPTRLVSLENTANRAGGTIMSPGAMQRVYALARERGLLVHLDGARIFNAAVALGLDVRRFTASCDSVTFCLSKGLGAPAGAILAGSRDFIDRARRYRKALGGGWRQAGVLAAAGLLALQNIDRLAEDHANARYLAEALATMPGLAVDLARVQTNIIIVGLGQGWTADAFVAALAAAGVRCNATAADAVRLVTHLDVSRPDIEAAIAACRRVTAAGPAKAS